MKTRWLPAPCKAEKEKMSTENPQPLDDDNPEQSPRLSPWVKGPLLMYLTMVAAFAIILIFVIRYVIIHGSAAAH